MNVKVLFIERGVHGSEYIQDRPEIRLRSRRVAEIDDQTHHFIGYDADYEEGRVNSAVTRFDRSTRKGITDSGRIYELLGNPGGCLDADYVWRRWRRINDVTREHDVTRDYLPAEPCPRADSKE